MLYGVAANSFVIYGMIRFFGATYHGTTSTQDFLVNQRFRGWCGSRLSKPCMTCTIPTLHLPNSLGAWISTIILFRSHLNHGELARISLINELCQLHGRLTWMHQHTQKPVNFVCIVYLAMALPMLELPASYTIDSTRLGTNQAVVPCRSDYHHPRILSCLNLANLEFLLLFLEPQVWLWCTTSFLLSTTLVWSSNHMPLYLKL